MIAAIYTRKSTEQNGVADEAKSVTRQIEQARAYAERKGWHVADEHIYSDDGISGAEFAARPGFLRLMNALTPKPAFDVLIMSEESRLGREQIEVGYALKQLVTAGVRVFCYLSDSERTLNSPIEKAMMSLQTMADELEREKARQRTYDAMQQKARKGHVTGGSCFGYRNVRQLDGPVLREIIEDQAAVVRRIFELCAEGHGLKQIAKQLNEQNAPCPKPQRGRPAGWAPSSVRSVLYRPLYRGEIVWNTTRKRNAWGQRQTAQRPESEWLRTPAPELRIVSDAAWAAAHARLEEARKLYLRRTDGQVWGRPARGTESKYLLVGLATCGVCGGGVSVRSRSHGRKRSYYYVCTAYHLRGRRSCSNHYETPMATTDAAVLDAIGQQVLSEALIVEAVERAAARLSQPDPEPRQAAARELEAVTAEISRLTTAIAAGGDLPSLIDLLKQREARKAALEAQVAAQDAIATMPKLGGRELRKALRARLEEWRAPLTEHVGHARQILRKLVVGRLTVTPDAERREAVISGQGTIYRLLSGLVVPKGLASPTGLEPVS